MSRASSMQLEMHTEFMFSSFCCCCDNTFPPAVIMYCVIYMSAFISLKKV